MSYELTMNPTFQNTANFVHPTVRYRNVSDIERAVICIARHLIMR
jgi:hypothetical protein